MMTSMHLTGNELTLIPSAVAAIAIVGGYLGVRSANRTTIRVAEQERSSHRQDELQAQKRATYAKLLAALNDLLAASLATSLLATPKQPKDDSVLQVVSRRLMDALAAASNATAEVELVTTNQNLMNLAVEGWKLAANVTADNRANYVTAIGNLRATMRFDLQGREVFSPAIQDASAKRPVDPRVPDQVSVSVSRRQAPPATRVPRRLHWGRRPVSAPPTGPA